MTPRRARLLFYPVHFLPEPWNGIDEHLLLLARSLDRDRFEPLLLHQPRDGPQTPALAERAGMRLVPAPEEVGPIRQRLHALHALLRRERVDILHIHTPAAGGQAIPALAARLAGVRATLVTYHQVQPRRLPARSRALNSLTHTLLIDATVAVSGDVRDTLVRAAGLPRRRIRVIRNGIDPAPPPAITDGLPPREPGEVRIGYFGRLSHEKGVHVLLRALAELAAQASHVRTFIVGDGPERAALAALAAQLGLGERVSFLGFRPDARALMAQVDIVAHVPIYEGFGLVVLEAMAAGRAVVTSDAPGGLRDIVDHKTTGLVVPVGDVGATARALLYLVEDAETRRRLGANGRARCVQHFSATHMAAQVTTLYETVLARRYAAGPAAAPMRAQAQD